MSDDLVERICDLLSADAKHGFEGSRNDLLREAVRRVRELEAERDALLRDAERYRWLRDRHEYNIAASEIVQEVSGEGWDAAIDAAMGNP